MNPYHDNRGRFCTKDQQAKAFWENKIKVRKETIAEQERLEKEIAAKYTHSETDENGKITKRMDVKKYYSELDERIAELHIREDIKIYKRFQRGVATKDTFYENSVAEFKKTTRPNREPDYKSEVSEYWYTEDGVIRGSDHWGFGVASCDWFLEGETRYFEVGKTQYGKARWEDFIQRIDL